MILPVRRSKRLWSVLAPKPLFGPIRLAGIPTGLYTLRSLQLLCRSVVTRAFFNQRRRGGHPRSVLRKIGGLLKDSTNEERALHAYVVSSSSRTENNFRFTQKPASCKHPPPSSVPMESHRRELVHAFRHRTLVLLKALMSQRRGWRHIHGPCLCSYHSSSSTATQ